MRKIFTARWNLQSTLSNVKDHPQISCDFLILFCLPFPTVLNTFYFVSSKKWAVLNLVHNKCIFTAELPLAMLNQCNFVQRVSYAPMYWVFLHREDLWDSFHPHDDVPIQDDLNSEWKNYHENITNMVSLHLGFLLPGHYLLHYNISSCILSCYSTLKELSLWWGFLCNRIICGVYVVELVKYARYICVHQLLPIWQFCWKVQPGARYGR